ncbi:MAG: hypothetical protein Sylvanvirus36_3 [Sylvanvirus sp.]|uniref:Uncharacterized protein n=1 Tax=Sylvanvirus sp. TaxID=2487774 RepID=A0A3G5AJY1_9VIRU|nr:MAG: hypothetical protein Sylvanvirus36_3 [Sylvanvirus sp.]
MRVCLYQPLVWLRLLKLIQQLYQSNDSIGSLAQLTWSLSENGLHLQMKSPECTFVMVLPSRECKCWDIPQHKTMNFIGFPVDWMLQWLQVYEPLMHQKIHQATGLIWEWMIEEKPVCQSSSKHESTYWGPHSPVFQMKIRRNDTMDIVCPPHHLNSSSSGSIDDPICQNYESGAFEVISKLHGNFNIPLSSYWNLHVHPEIHPSSHSFQYQDTRSPSFNHTYRISPDECRRLLAEWLVLPPGIECEWWPHQGLIVKAAGSHTLGSNSNPIHTSTMPTCFQATPPITVSPHIRYRQQIPYSSGVIIPVGPLNDPSHLSHSNLSNPSNPSNPSSTIPRSQRITTVQLLQLYRLVTSVPPSQMKSIEWNMTPCPRTSIYADLTLLIHPQGDAFIGTPSCLSLTLSTPMTPSIG